MGPLQWFGDLGCKWRLNDCSPLCCLLDWRVRIVRGPLLLRFAFSRKYPRRIFNLNLGTTQELRFARRRFALRDLPAGCFLPRTDAYRRQNLDSTHAANWSVGLGVLPEGACFNLSISSWVRFIIVPTWSSGESESKFRFPVNELKVAAFDILPWIVAIVI